MDARLVELYVERGRLRERIGSQRAQLAGTLAPLSQALHSVDRTRARMHRLQLWMAANPGIVAAVAVAVVVARPRLVVRSARWGFSVWRNWGRWRDWLRMGMRVL
jgi:hypothetical protein